MSEKIELKAKVAEMQKMIESNGKINQQYIEILYQEVCTKGYYEGYNILDKYVSDQDWKISVLKEIVARPLGEYKKIFEEAIKKYSSKEIIKILDYICGNNSDKSEEFINIIDEFFKQKPNFTLEYNKDRSSITNFNKTYSIENENGLMFKNLNNAFEKVISNINIDYTNAYKTYERLIAICQQYEEIDRNVIFETCLNNAGILNYENAIKNLIHYEFKDRSKDEVLKFLNEQVSFMSQGRNDLKLVAALNVLEEKLEKPQDLINIKKEMLAKSIKISNSKLINNLVGNDLELSKEDVYQLLEGVKSNPFALKEVLPKIIDVYSTSLPSPEKLSLVITKDVSALLDFNSIKELVKNGVKPEIFKDRPDINKKDRAELKNLHEEYKIEFKKESREIKKAAFELIKEIRGIINNSSVSEEEKNKAIAGVKEGFKGKLTKETIITVEELVKDIQDKQKQNSSKNFLNELIERIKNIFRSKERIEIKNARKEAFGNVDFNDFKDLKKSLKEITKEEAKEEFNRIKSISKNNNQQPRR